MTADQISHRWRTGQWIRIGVRSFVVAGTAPTWEQQLTAGLLDLGDQAVVSHRAAAALFGFEGFPAASIEFTIPRRGGGAECSWRVHTTGTLEQIDRDRIGMFRCTSASRTVIDLARTASAAELERAIDSAVRDGFSSPSFLRRRLTALRGSGRAGVRLLDDLLVDSGGHSDLERAFLRLVRQAGLPRPSCQRIFRRDGRTLARVDFSFEPLPVLAEVSGRRGHSSDAERAKDGRRRNELQHAGFTVLDFTDGQVRRDPAYVVQTLRLHLLPERSWPIAPQGLRPDRP
jgi:very-short-patch-repair endonuclease